MESIGKITEDIINRIPFLRESMTEGLINVSALARKIQPEIEQLTGKEVKEGAIVMAIKRMSPGVYHKINVKIKNVLGDLGDVIVRSNLQAFSFVNTETSVSKKSEVVKIVMAESDGFFAMCKGNTETTLITNDKHEATVARLFKNERITNHLTGLSSISIRLPEMNMEVQGFYYYILKQLAWQGINVLEVLSSTNEFTILVKHTDVNNAFLILNQLKSGYINF